MEDDSFNDDLLLTSDVARVLGKSVSTVGWYERIGRIRAFKTIGGTRLYPRREVERVAAALRRRALKGGR